MSRAHGHYFDARTLRTEPVELVFGSTHLHVVRAGGDATMIVPLAEVRVSDRLAHVPRFLYLPDDRAIETPANEVIDALLARRGAGRVNAVVHWLEQRVRVAAIATVLLAVSLIAALFYGLPIAARAAATNVPAEIERQAGRAALATFSTYLAPSRLSFAEKQAVHAQLDRLVLAQGLPAKPTLEFRAMGQHANAFALPGGIIIVSDALVRLGSDQEIAAVLAHEIGHWQSRHGLQSVLRSSTALLVVTAVTGDLSTLTTFAATIPLTLLQRGYSREFEREADDYAIALLRRAKIDVRHMASILDKLEKSRKAGRNDYSYLSTHPSTSDRLQRIDPSGTFAEFAREQSTFDLSALTEAPEFTLCPLPEVPVALRAQQSEGDVLVSFEIDEIGRASRVRIQRSPHPDFAAATTAAVERWRFLPGRMGYRTVVTRAEATVQFRPDRAPIVVSGMKLPTEANSTAAGDPHSTPPQLTRTIQPEFPLHLRMAGTSGTVTLEFIVDVHGQVLNPKVLESTHPSFEAPALAAVAQWEFKPGRREGRAVNTRVQQVITFNLDEPESPKTVSAPPPPPSRTVTDILVAHARPTILVQTAPAYPPGLRSMEADVRVEFSVDRDGRVTKPRVILSTNPNFDEAALATVRNWRFTSQPEGVDPRVRDTFRYEIHFRRTPGHPPATALN